MLRLFSGVDFTRLLLFFRFLFYFRGSDKPIAFVSFWSSKKQSSIEEKPVVEGPMDLGLGLIEEKPNNGLGREIGATTGPGVTSVAIQG
jgi:hypothetical protein